MIKGFISFFREQGIIGLAIGFILGAGVAKVVSSLVNDIVTPILGLILGKGDNLRNLSFDIGTSRVLLGNFIANLIDFAVLALVIYFVLKIIGLDRLDKKKE
jgi:large conductance mechanosensitive channel